LMRSFYSSLAQGMSKAAALVAAQRYIVQRFPDTAVPWYWAGYMLEGDGGTPLVSATGRDLQRRRRTSMRLRRSLPLAGPLKSPEALGIGSVIALGGSPADR
jgi:hypothetical protein